MGFTATSDEMVIQALVDDYLEKKGKGKSNQNKRNKGRKKKSKDCKGGEYDVSP